MVRIVPAGAKYAFYNYLSKIKFWAIHQDYSLRKRNGFVMKGILYLYRDFNNSLKQGRLTQIQFASVWCFALLMDNLYQADHYFLHYRESGSYETELLKTYSLPRKKIVRMISS